MPLAELNDILVFALDNAYIQMPDGTIMHQAKGIPMGDPLSPGMTISTCAWMEREWMKQLAPIDKCFFKGARYMNDILLFTSKNKTWNSEMFLEDFTRSECYWKPLKLEPSQPGRFLETIFQKQDDNLTFRLKNDNEVERKVWRYHDYESRLDYTTKRATIKNALQKVHSMASDYDQLAISAMAKCKEFCGSQLS
jgi:hypothetical protein